jgi:hypothetical protein
MAILQRNEENQPARRWCRAVTFAGVMALLFLTGCVRRKIVVNSNPPGARVYFDGEYMGDTPVEFPFKWYGGHRLRLEQEGYDDTVNVVELRAPLHLKMPFDFIAELAPFPVEDKKEFRVEMRNRAEPESEEPEEDLRP